MVSATINKVRREILHSKEPLGNKIEFSLFDLTGYKLIIPGLGKATDF